jgi:methionine-rich copper-binding protein CopC
VTRRIFALLAAVVVLVAGSGAGPALAAFRVLGSTPAAGSTVTRPPDEVRITFDQAVNDEVSTIHVHPAGAGDSYATIYNLGLVRATGSRELVQSVRLLPPATYEVSWTAGAGGASPTSSGSFQFTVAAPPHAATGAGQWIIIGILALISLFLAISLIRRRIDRRGRQGLVRK